MAKKWKSPNGKWTINIVQYDHVMAEIKEKGGPYHYMYIQKDGRFKSDIHTGSGVPDYVIEKAKTMLRSV